MSQFGVSNPLMNVHDCILCSLCETRVAYVEDFVPNADDLVYGGYFDRLFHFVIPVTKRGHLEQLDGNILLNIYCVNCRMRLGWKLVATTQQSDYFVIGRFFMKLELLIYQSGETLRDAVFGVADEQAPNDQDWGVNEQVPNDQDLGTNDQDVGTDETKADQDGGANEKNADQDGDTNEQNTNEQDLGANDQNPEQDGGPNADQDGGANADQDGDDAQNHEQDGGRPTKRKKI